MNIKYGLMAVIWDEEFLEVLHFCGYENQPSEADFHDLLNELKTDPQFELNERNDWQLMEAPPAMVEYYKNVIPPDADSYCYKGDVKYKMGEENAL